MATTIRAAGFAFAALVQAFAAPSFAANLEAGRYDALMLAVTPDHQVEGYYLEELGEGVSRRCTFICKARSPMASLRRSLPGASRRLPAPSRHLTTA